MVNIVFDKKIEKSKKATFLNICRTEGLIRFNPSNRLWLLCLEEYEKDIREIAKEIGIVDLISFSPSNERNVKITFGKSGGNSSVNTRIARIALPASWVREMGISPESSEAKISFCNNKIIIERKDEI